MYCITPSIDTPLEAIDALEDLRHDLSGLATFVLALKMTDIADEDALGLVAQLLAHYSEVLDMAIVPFEQLRSAEE